MKNHNILAGVGAGLLLLTAVGGAQTPTVPQIQLAVRRPQPGLRFKGEVVHADMGSIIVRDRKNERVIRTFSYSEKAREQMETIMARGGFQFGDKVEIRYEERRDVALEIRGGPSRSTGVKLLHAE
jgi:hypothetical protein